MATIRGEDLGKIAQKRGPMPPAEVARTLALIAAALEKLHAEGRAHRDLRPESILIREGEGSPSVELRDARAAEMGEGPETRKARLLSTPLYLSPEQVRGDKAIGPAADIHALAHIGYTLLAGEPYFQVEKEQTGAVFELLARIVGGAFEPPHIRAARRTKVTLPEGFDAWFGRAAAADPRDRYKSAQAAADAFAKMVGDAPAAPRPAEGGGGPSRAVLTVGGVMLSIAIGAVMVWLARGAPDETAAAMPTAEPPPAATSAAPSAEPALSAEPASTASAPPVATASAEPASSAAAAATGAAAPTSTATAAVTSSTATAAVVASSAAPSTTAAAGANKPAGVSACAAPLFPAGTFAATPDFAFLCSETDPRRGAATVKSKVVLGSAKTLSEGKLEWGGLGWYEMPAFALIRARCCAAPAALKLPQMAGDCGLAERLNELTAAALAATGEGDEKLRTAMDGFNKSVACVQRGNAGADLFAWPDKPTPGAEAIFRKTVARLIAGR